MRRNLGMFWAVLATLGITMPAAVGAQALNGNRSDRTTPAMSSQPRSASAAQGLPILLLGTGAVGIAGLYDIAVLRDRMKRDASAGLRMGVRDGGAALSWTQRF